MKIYKNMIFGEFGCFWPYSWSSPILLEKPFILIYLRYGKQANLPQIWPGAFLDFHLLSTRGEHCSFGFPRLPWLPWLPWPSTGFPGFPWPFLASAGLPWPPWPLLDSHLLSTRGGVGAHGRAKGGSRHGSQERPRVCI